MVCGNIFPMEVTWTHIICMDAQNFHGRTEFAWTHRICTNTQNLYGCSTEIIQSGGASQWRVCHQRGLPRLVPSISLLSSQYRHSYLPNNGFTAAVAYAAVTAVTDNIDAAVKLIASLEDIIAAMMTHSHCNSYCHSN